MKVLYAGLYWSYGDPAKDLSYEHVNIEAGFRDCAERGLFEVEYFYPDKTRHEMGRKEADQWLFDLVQRGEIDAIFHVAFNDSIDLPHNILQLAKLRGIATMQWDCDASWRFQNWILPRKDLYTHFITTHSGTIPWYESAGMNVIKSQWGGSPLYSRPEDDVEKIYDVSFVGQKHGIRPDLVNAIIGDGIKLDLFGSYWEGYPNWHGYCTFDQMLDVFRKSKICLNFSNPWHVGTSPQIKGRHFEIPQIGGFQLCTPADDLHSYFEFGREIVVAQDERELLQHLHYYLDASDERQEIAEAGYYRMLTDHQWSHRLTETFREVGLLT